MGTRFGACSLLALCVLPVAAQSGSGDMVRCVWRLDQQLRLVIDTPYPELSAESDPGPQALDAFGAAVQELGTEPLRVQRLARMFVPLLVAVRGGPTATHAKRIHARLGIDASIQGLVARATGTETTVGDVWLTAACNRMLALRAIEDLHAHGAVAGLRELQRGPQKDDPLLQALVADAAGARLQLGREEPTAQPLTVSLPAGVEGIVAARFDDLGGVMQLAEAWRRAMFRLANDESAAQGPSLSPGMKLSWQRAIDQADYLAWELFRQFGAWRVRSLALGRDRETGALVAEVAGLFETARLARQLREHGVATDERAGRLQVVGGGWELALAAGEDVLVGTDQARSPRARWVRIAPPSGPGLVVELPALDGDTAERPQPTAARFELLADGAWSVSLQFQSLASAQAWQTRLRELGPSPGEHGQSPLWWTERAFSQFRRLLGRMRRAHLPEGRAQLDLGPETPERLVDVLLALLSTGAF